MVGMQQLKAPPLERSGDTAMEGCKMNVIGTPNSSFNKSFRAVLTDILPKLGSGVDLSGRNLSPAGNSRVEISADKRLVDIQV